MSMSGALSGLRASRAEIEATSNNVANVSTVGYKRSEVEFESLLSGTKVSGVRSSFAQGSITETGKPLDVAITGSGFFSIRSKIDAELEYYTRAGAFELDNENYLVNSGGQFVMGYASVNGAMPTPLGDLTGLQLLDSKASPNLSIDAVQISSVGKVTALYSNGTEKIVGQIALTSFKETSRLQSVGASQYVKTDRSGPPVTGLSGTNSTGSMLAGSIEGSNVDISEELIELITAQRNYQAAAKVLETSSEIAEVVRHIKV